MMQSIIGGVDDR